MRSARFTIPVVMIALFAVSHAAEPKGLRAVIESFESAPLFVAYGFEKDATQNGLAKVTFYSETDDPSETDWAKLPLDCYLVSSDDRMLQDRVRQHFSMLRNPKAYSGSTMYSSIWKNGTRVRIVHVDRKLTPTVVFEGDITIAYLYCPANREEVQRLMSLHPDKRTPPPKK